VLPDVEFVPSSNGTFTRLATATDEPTGMSMPIYHGSIVRIEQHANHRHGSDLIVRVPNFQCSVLSLTDIPTRMPTKVKRRAPICPIVREPFDRSNRVQTPSMPMDVTRHPSALPSPVVNAHRLTSGLRSLSRVFTHGCRSKPSSNIEPVTYPSALPDVELMRDEMPTAISSLSHRQHSTLSMTKLPMPTIRFVKEQRRSSHIECSTSISIDTQTSSTTDYTELTVTKPRITSFMHRPIENELGQSIDCLDDDERSSSETRTSIDLISEGDVDRD
jgi:hypothetical protein